MAQPEQQSLIPKDFLTDEVEVEQSPIPAYTEHVVIKRLIVTTPKDTGLFYGYPDTPDVRRSYSLMQKMLTAAHDEAVDSKAGGVNPQQGQLFGVKAALYGGDGSNLLRRCVVMDVLESIAKVC